MSKPEKRYVKKNMYISKKRYLSVYPGVSAAMAGVYFIPAKTAQLDPEKDKYTPPVRLT